MRDRARVQPGSNLPIDAERLWQDLMALARITEPGKPYTRRSFTPMFDAGRRWLEARLQDAGCAISVDQAGNLIGRIEGTAPETGTIVIGSHTDTVPAGGRFDGSAGVLAGLEVLRSLNERGIRLRHNIEVVDFLAEEPSEFGLSCVGSRAMTGRLEPGMLDYLGPEGETLGAAVRRVGGTPEALTGALRGDIVAFFELHIEQGVVLETNGIEIGIVTGIAGVTRLEIRFGGSADHAGTTPMHLRRDASIAAARLTLFANAEAQRIAARGNGHFVATTGVIDIAPNAANVVPREARIIVDARAECRADMEEFLESARREAGLIAEDCAVGLEGFRVLSDSHPVPCDPGLRAALHHATQGLGLSRMDMASGAGHDAAFVAGIAPAAMVFIPSLAGKSHTPEEWSEPAEVAAGAAVLFEAVLLCDSPDTAARAEPAGR